MWKVNTSRPDSGSILIIQNNQVFTKDFNFMWSMTFNSMNHIQYSMYAYINLLSKVGFHSYYFKLWEWKQSENPLSFDFTLLI